jgi:putative ABC transport system permease protein
MGAAVEHWNQLVLDRLRNVSRETPDSRLVEELASHLSQAYDRSRRNGRTHEEAQADAMRLLDSAAPLRQAVIAARPTLSRRVETWVRQEPGETGGLMSRFGLRNDARYALRMLVRTPTFSAVAILTFAVAIGINTAVFTVVNGVLLRPLPYPDSDRITMIWMDNRPQGIREDITSYPNFLDWRSQATSYAHMAGMRPSSFSLTGAGEPERLLGAAVTASFFDVMGVAPIRGRVFGTEHETPGRDLVAVVSHGLWQRRFGGAEDVIGRTIALNSQPHEVIGVMPPSLQWPDKAELWRPLAPADGLRTARGAFWLPVVGRLKPGIPVDQAQAEMAGIAARLEAAYPQANSGFGANVVSLHRQLVGGIERGLLVLLGAVAFVLLIACANLANLMLGRTAARKKELAIRTALGAARARIVRQIVTESLVLALVGGAIGAALAYWATAFFVAVGGNAIPRPDEIRLDGRVLAFTLLLATAAALLAGLVPAIQASRSVVVDHLREGGRQGGAVASRRTRHALVAAEVALAFVLLTGAGLLTRTLWSMQQLERGFRTEGIVTATLSLPGSSYAGPPELRAFYTRLLERVRSLPGVESAATTTGVLQPLVTNSNVYGIEGRPDPPPEQRIEYPVEVVSPDFFATLGIEIVQGRALTDQDHADAPAAVVINQTLAKLGWPGEDPIGRRVRPGGTDSQAPWSTVVGVIRDVHRAEATRAIRPEIYHSALQVSPRTQTIVVRTAVDPTSILPSLRREVQALDPQVPLFAVGTLQGQVQDTLRQPRFQAILLAGFAAIALLLSAIGIYGVTAHAVSQRTHEVGVRMALGARGRDVLALILAQHLTPAIVGVAIGFAGAFALSRSLRSLLYGVTPGDPLTFGLMAAGLVGVAVAACWIPARRATRVDPLVALRTE